MSKDEIKYTGRITNNYTKETIELGELTSSTIATPSRIVKPRGGVGSMEKTPIMVVDEKDNLILNAVCSEINISTENLFNKNYMLESHTRKIKMVVQNAGSVSDGYHTFDELYYHRMVLFATICNQNYDIAWKSWKHHDGTMYDDYFIVGVETPKGQYSYHYHKDYWDIFKCCEHITAPEWDGHQPSDIDRLLTLI